MSFLSRAVELCGLQERHNETDFSAPRPAADEGARIPQTDEIPGRPSDDQSAARQRPQTPVGCLTPDRVPPMKPHGMPRRWRLTERSAIRAVFAKGRYHKLGLLHAKTLASTGTETRFLVSVRKNFGNAPERNRLKRLVRESVRLDPPRLPVPYDICFFVSAPLPQPPTLADVQRD